MSKHEFHPLVKQLLDGDITLADLPPELRAEGDEALQQLGIGEDGALSLWHEGHSFVKIAERGRR